MSNFNLKFPYMIIKKIEITDNDNKDISVFIELYDQNEKYIGSFTLSSANEFNDNNFHFSQNVYELIDMLFSNIEKELKNKTSFDFTKN